MEISLDIAQPHAAVRQLMEQIRLSVTTGILKPGALPRAASSPTISPQQASRSRRLTAVGADSISETKGYRGTLCPTPEPTQTASHLQEVAPQDPAK